MPRLFEVGYPAHPEIIDARRVAVNKCCFQHPSILKNEIEYMHSKLEGIELDDPAAILEDGKHLYKKEFQTGKIGEID